jgi:flagellar basal-body rod protein FlgB
MALSVISDLTTRSLQQAMKGLSARRQALSNDVANSEVPGYLATTTSFEDSLAQAISSGAPESMQTTFGKSDAPTNMNGNNVSVEQSFVDLSENQLQQQLAVEAMNAKYRLLRTSITGM